MKLFIYSSANAENRIFIYLGLLAWVWWGCSKNSNAPEPARYVNLDAILVDGVNSGFKYQNVKSRPEIQLRFSAPLSQNSVNNEVTLRNRNEEVIPIDIRFERSDSMITVSPKNPLRSYDRFELSLGTGLKSRDGANLQIPLKIELNSGLDTTDKLTRIPKEELLTLVQKQTFRYFWDHAHPVSGMIRERFNSGDVVTTGGTGFGTMAILVGIERNFISREQGLERVTKITRFLEEKTTRYHGAFAHWLNGASGQTIPFSTYDDGADLVETSLLMQGLLAVRQYFDRNTSAETDLRASINAMWDNIEWSWFTKNGEKKLYWHWSPQHEWRINLPISGWNEALITYVMAASSPEVSSDTYNGWTEGNHFRNGKHFYGYQLPLGEDYGGPLFLSQYSFLGLDPRKMKDQYADYFTQNRNHTLINRSYCIENPKSFAGYSADCWGLSASDIPGGYTAGSPLNDNGTITPTAAISAFPYTPEESLEALEFFYYKLGDRLWTEYGFRDAFNPSQQWFADSHLAIDQGPIIIMIENHRSGLLWQLFMSCPEIKEGLKKLGFTGG